APVQSNARLAKPCWDAGCRLPESVQPGEFLLSGATTIHWPDPTTEQTARASETRFQHLFPEWSATSSCSERPGSGPSHAQPVSRNETACDNAQTESRSGSKA